MHDNSGDNEEDANPKEIMHGDKPREECCALAAHVEWRELCQCLKIVWLGEIYFRSLEINKYKTQNNIYSFLFCLHTIATKMKQKH